MCLRRKFFSVICVRIGKFDIHSSGFEKLFIQKIALNIGPILILIEKT
jgi:hypothetical protein